MNGMLKIIKEMFKEAMCDVSYAIKINLGYIAATIQGIVPYVMYATGQSQGITNGKFTIGFELVIPILVNVIAYFMHGIAKRYNKGSSIPVPNERFTSESEYGEVTIENNRLQELILYLDDLENWMERKGLLK